MIKFSLKISLPRNTFYKKCLEFGQNFHQCNKQLGIYLVEVNSQTSDAKDALKLST